MLSKSANLVFDFLARAFPQAGIEPRQGRYQGLNKVRIFLFKKRNDKLVTNS